MNIVKRKTCPVTCSDEIVVTFLDPEELVTTQRKMPNGKYERVLKPRKEVKGGLSPEIACPSQGHPAIDTVSPLGIKLWKEGKAWCRKIKKECPMEQIIKGLL